MVPEGWKNTKVGDNIKFSGGSQPPREVFSEENKDGYIRLIQIRDYKTDKYATYIPQSLAKKFCDKYDVMIGRYGPPIFQILRGLEGAYNVALIKAIPLKNVERDYMYYFLKREPLLRYIESFSQRTSGQTGIEMDLLKSYPMPLPTCEIQKKIAKILSTWDRAIEVTEKLISNSQGQQKSLTQQLLTGKKRLEGFKKNNGVIKTRYGLIPDDWDFVSIESIAEQFVKKNSDENDYPVLSCSKYVGFVDSLKYFKKKVYSDNTSGYKIIERGCFGFPSNHIEEGSIGYQNLYEAGLVSPIYTVFKANNKLVNDLFLYKLLKTEHYRQIFAAATNASVDRRGSLRWKEFGKIKIMLPSLKEQKKIALVLSTADKEIETLQQKLEFTKQEKKALMQQLLTGKRRVKIDEEDISQKEVVRA